MRAYELIRSIQDITNTNGECIIEISVLKQPDIPAEAKGQQYLSSSPTHVVFEESDGEKRICIRDWPY